MRRTDRSVPPRWTVAPGLPATAPTRETADRPVRARVPREPFEHPRGNAPRPPRRPVRRSGPPRPAVGRPPALRFLGFGVATVLIAVVVGLLSTPAHPPQPGEPQPAGPPIPSADPGTSVEPSGAPVPPASAGGGSGRAAPRAAALIAQQSTQLGSVVVDADGFTLYRYDGDSPGASSCADACLSTWRPATVDPAARLALNGVDTSRVGLVRRSDGTFQLTINDWPLYRFAGDTRPGRNSGHGIGGKWFAIRPSGEKAAPP